MSKVLTASCAAGVVTAEGVTVPSATILSQGTAQSNGVLILDEDDAFYIAQRDSDLKTTLEKLIESLTQIKTGLDKAVEALNKAASALTTLDTNGFLIAADAGVPSPPVATSDISGIGTASGAITTAATAIDSIKTELGTFKDTLK